MRRAAPRGSRPARAPGRAAPARPSFPPRGCIRSSPRPGAPRCTSAAHEDVHVLLPVGVREVVDARARHGERVPIGTQHVHDHLGVLRLAAGLGAVLAVAGDVEDAPQLLLQLERLADRLLAPRVVLARRNRREGLLAGEEGVAWVRGRGFEGHGRGEKDVYSSFSIMSASARRRLAAFTWWPSISRPFRTTVPRPSRWALSSASITSIAAARSWGFGVNASLQ